MSEYYKDYNRYDDIIDLPHHQSKERPHMSLHDRAAQFAPFAALTGYEDAIEETARITDQRIILTDTELEEINRKLSHIAENLNTETIYSFTYFKADKRKNGGSYLTDVGSVKKINSIEQTVIMQNEIIIPMKDITYIEECAE